MRLSLLHHHRRKLSLSLGLLLLSWLPAGAQIAPADDFFNSGAQFYISNNIPQAKQITEMGLKNYPDDVKLQKLEKLLQQQQNQQNQQQQQQQQSQSQQNQQNQQAKAQEQKQNQQQQQKPDQQQDQEQQAMQQMSEKQAKDLLDKQKDNESVLQLKPADKPHDFTHIIKDW